ncbi:hypothetical protein BH24DEI2_BH24DEI2_23030 [soil metagenome]
MRSCNAKKSQRTKAPLLGELGGLLLTLGLLLGTAWAQKVPDAYLPLATDTRIIPTPQEEVALPEGYTLTPETVIYLLEPTPALQRAAAELQTEIQARYGFRPPLAVGQAPQAGIVIETLESGLSPVGGPVAHDEGYTLEVTPTSISIVGTDERGAFYGVQSLLQILSETPSLRGLRVRDWPDHGLRVAMIYLNGDSAALNDRLVPLLARYKFNAVLVMSDYVAWDSAPELHVPGSASKDEARRLVERARAYLLEPFPLLETLGHAQWLFANGQNRDLLQDGSVSSPFAYDPLNPRVYEVLFPILDELIDVFQPRYLHIGHDEVRSGHPFPASEEGLELGFGELFLKDTLKLHDFLTSRGAGTMLWQDELLSTEVQPLLSRFPQDLTVTSWNYIPAGDYPDLTALQEVGFEVLGTSWQDPDNITAYSRFAHAAGAAGMVQARWTGYFASSEVLHGSFEQLYAYLSAANAFWNVDAPVLEDAPERFRTFWLGTDNARQRAGTLIGLNPYGNLNFRDGFLGLEPGYALEPMLATDRFAGARFSLGDAVALRGTHRRTQAYPQAVDIALGLQAGSLAFLQTTGWSAPVGSEVGRYVVHYADGGTETFPLVYGENIAAWTETVTSSINLLQGWSGRTLNGLPVAVNAFFWTNPRPDVVINSVEFVSDGLLANPVLLGLTVLE